MVYVPVHVCVSVYHKCFAPQAPFPSQAATTLWGPVEEEEEEPVEDLGQEEEQEDPSSSAASTYRCKYR